MDKWVSSAASLQTRLAHDWQLSGMIRLSAYQVWHRFVVDTRYSINAQPPLPAFCNSETQKNIFPLAQGGGTAKDPSFPLDSETAAILSRRCCNSS